MKTFIIGTFLTISLFQKKINIFTLKKIIIIFQKFSHKFARNSFFLCDFLELIVTELELLLLSFISGFRRTVFQIILDEEWEISFHVLKRRWKGEGGRHKHIQLKNKNNLTSYRIFIENLLTKLPFYKNVHRSFYIRKLLLVILTINF